MVPKNLEMKSGDLNAYLSSIEIAIRNLWKPPVLDYYTDHGIEHSERVIENLSKLLEGHSDILNDYERFILLASAYLHDVGMQAPSYAGIDRPSGDYTINDKEIIREKHNEISAEIIKNSVSGEPIIMYNNKKLRLGFELCPEYARFVAQVSKYHRILNLTTLDDSSISGENLKLTLLAALLRLGDELDADHRRVNLEILKLREIPLKSKLHWWGHYYVQSVSIEGGRIKLYFRFPEMYKNEAGVAALFRKRTCSSIRSQLDEVNNILFDNGIRLYPKPEVVQTEYDDCLVKMPDELSDYTYDYVLYRNCEGIRVHTSPIENYFSLHKFKSDFDSDVILDIVKCSDYLKFNYYNTKDSPMYLFTTYPVERILPIKIKRNIWWVDKGVSGVSSGIPVTAISKISSIDERVKVPAGTFERCVRVDTTFEIPANPEVTRYKTKSVWWKEGVGPIQIKVDFEDSEPCSGKLIETNVNDNENNNDNEFWPMSTGYYWIYRWKLSRTNNSDNILIGNLPRPDIYGNYSRHADSA